MELKGQEVGRITVASVMRLGLGAMRGGRKRQEQFNAGGAG